MAKKDKNTKICYVCQSCGQVLPKWAGKCPGCGEWNTIVEEVVSPRPRGSESGMGTRAGGKKTLYLSAVDIGDVERLDVKIGELNGVLGGGLVKGSVVLVGGDPGVGKTTLLMQMLGNLAKAGVKSLYVTGEESSAQLKMRGARLGVDEKSFLVLFSTNLEEILDAISDLTPMVVVVDSIQTTSTDLVESTPGSVSQLRTVAHLLTSMAKEQGIAVLLVGHITKDGSIAGPKVLEHLVDTVLYFEGGAEYPYRILKAHKNRFGPTDEVGVFEMREGGLFEVADPTGFFLSERVESEPGSAVTSALEGTRTLLVEVQSLVTPSPLAVPRRTSMGIDYNRVNIMAAIIEKKGRIELSNHDIFVNVAGGIKINEPALDAALAASLVSSYLDVAVPADTVVFGEVGLSGEVRGVSQGGKRISEAKKLGFTRAVVPKRNAGEPEVPSGIEVHGIKSIGELIEALFKKGGEGGGKRNCQ
ncbi:MAG: DNA repair protein RadA [Deltaproteobacteria bacterium]|uniref:DNA repair protein RadA n=1 Tax=Candidatus Zymogenus saltonus TaxID=2844893 RepID=A0A9D8KEN9_9DELT|nr:DNA repair protein RadA [Candidatus Zymogenus saltonus]